MLNEAGKGLEAPAGEVKTTKVPFIANG